MSFIVAADAYDRFMGRYSVPLAPELADFAEVEAGQRVLDVGCGPGALTAELVSRLGPGTLMAASVNGEEGLWIGFKIENDHYWMLLDRARFTRVGGKSLVSGRLEFGE